MYFKKEDLLSEEQVMSNDHLFTDEDEIKFYNIMQELINSEQGVKLLKDKGFSNLQILNIVSGSYLE